MSSAIIELFRVVKNHLQNISFKLHKIMAPHRMKAKRTSSSFVAKSPFHQRKKMPIFPVPVSSVDVEFNQTATKKKSAEQSASYLLEKIGRVLRL